MAALRNSGVLRGAHVRLGTVGDLLAIAGIGTGPSCVSRARREKVQGGYIGKILRLLRATIP